MSLTDQRLIDALAEVRTAKLAWAEAEDRAADVADKVGRELLASAGLRVGAAFLRTRPYAKHPLYARIGPRFRIAEYSDLGLTVSVVPIKKNGERARNRELVDLQLERVITEATSEASVAFHDSLAAIAREAQP